ncbi:2-succinyl-5-enolpyruvyl-6-hydroxy-3-cyclohexene-1-carboxylic-acid synthase [Flavobacterium agrisoli]|uniref:2-succinyl-5-enolpyruvyl-6-hydroxy-3-cyclohexene-1-carboxylate synthase n=1 Tax=Flavobacterium agrisoli TaxID=2793066 RepID=A0A934UIB2_9FLAO|nr:2-succinyl-5-enolpyruvyl-6-hydroxy-3-cyclohexene-1-carboxylic-acid synthase [Flavobacterium agrisoli]MBK0368205.1 2-succinyl-5-enolpyruvyl-6-hydroxy-3-cyclohexene-1-carboxylic-acid synthase [Flavobacterium agrisoli]
MIYPKIALAQSIIEIFKAKGLTEIIISPGSRNAPLTIGFASNPNFNCYSIADERCAAFFALGMAQQLKTPTVLVCTSGSALLNYYPAFAEAFYSQIPLIVISADRPQNKIDIGDGQTIRQENVYANHSLFNANLVEEASEENDVKINQAIHTAILQKGPVHINVPFEEPLYETVSEISVTPKIFPFESNLESNTKLDFSALIQSWNTSSRKMILVGVNNPDEISQKVIDFWAKDPSVLVLTEVTSNLHHEKFINHIDVLINPFDEEDFKELQPDILITFGGMIVSKRIKAFLRKYKPQQHWHIDTLRAYDTFGSLSHPIKMNPNVFFESFLSQTQNKESDYFNKISNIFESRKVNAQKYLSKIAYSDLKVYEKVLKALPENAQLQISNSAAIRYAQLISFNNSITVFCNRGTSGIDGSTSTAIGAATTSDNPTILLTGDISFLYDSNALWNAYIPQNFKIILVNNSGGGIFRILPGHQENAVFNTYFETSHQLTAKHLAEMYQMKYCLVQNEFELEQSLNDFFEENDKPSILEISTPTLENDLVLKRFFKELA